MSVLLESLKEWGSGKWCSGTVLRVLGDDSIDMCESGVTKMTSSHHGGELFTAMKNPVGRTVRRDSMSIRIRDLSSDIFFHEDSENISFM